MKALFIGFILLVCSFQSFAEKGGAHGGGGGGGIEIGADVFLIDLYEAGVHSKVVFPSPADEAFTRHLVECEIPIEVAILISKKLTEVAEYDPVFADAVLQAFKLLTWFEGPSELKITADNAELLINEKVVQVARRDGGMVRINSSYYNRMPLSHRAALLFHEAAGALTPYHVPSKHLRGIIATIFSSRISQMSIVEIRELLDVYVNAKDLGRLTNPIFYTRVDPMGSYKGTEFYYAPSMYLKWKDLRSPFERFLLAPQYEPSSFDLFPFIAKVPGYKFCEKIKQQLSLMSFDIRYYRLKLSLPKVEKEGVQPRFIVKLKPETVIRTFFAEQRSRFQAACTRETKNELKEIFEWSATLQEF